MKHILAPILLLVLLFPSLALSEEVTRDDLVERDGIYYKKFADVPFTGKVTGQGQGQIKDGVRDGPWVEYHDNGQLSSKGDYKSGKKEGSWVTYDENGELDQDLSGTYENGVKLIEDCRILNPGKYKDDGFTKDGLWVEYLPGGYTSIGTYKNGKLEGPWVQYYENCQVQAKGTYKNGLPEGPWVGYHEDGQLWAKGENKNGKQEGFWIVYHDDGTVWEKHTGTYKDGVRIYPERLDD